MLQVCLLVFVVFGFAYVLLRPVHMRVGPLNCDAGNLVRAGDTIAFEALVRVLNTLCTINLSARMSLSPARRTCTPSFTLAKNYWDDILER
jgi:hypothetical protein